MYTTKDFDHIVKDLEGVKVESVEFSNKKGPIETMEYGYDHYNAIITGNFYYITKDYEKTIEHILCFIEGCVLTNLSLDYLNGKWQIRVAFTENSLKEEPCYTQVDY
jgi:hypothetical protein